MADKTKENNLSVFLKDFADGLRDLYPEKKNNNEKIKPEDFADLIAPDKYEEGLKPENIKKDEIIFGVKGTAEGTPQPPTISYNEEWNTDYYDQVIATTADGKTIGKYIYQIDNNLRSRNLKFGTRVLNQYGQYCGTFIPSCTVSITSDSDTPFTVAYAEGGRPADHERHPGAGTTSSCSLTCSQWTALRLTFRDIDSSKKFSLSALKDNESTTVTLPYVQRVEVATATGEVYNYIDIVIPQVEQLSITAKWS